MMVQSSRAVEMQQTLQAELDALRQELVVFQPRLLCMYIYLFLRISYDMCMCLTLTPSPTRACGSALSVAAAQEHHFVVGVRVDAVLLSLTHCGAPVLFCQLFTHRQ